MFENKERTEISKLGEFGLIQHLTEKFEIFQKDTMLGVGDDSAVLTGSEKLRLITTELFLENVHFDLMYSPLKHIGYKAVVAAISDIYAMNGNAEQIMVSIGLSSKYSLEAVEDLYFGINAACQKYRLDLVGGDTTTSVTGLALSITAIGSVAEAKLTKRNGAKEGDLLCVTGDLGAAYLGLQILEREKQVFLASKDMQPDLEGKDYIIGRQLRPEARKDIIETLEEIKIQPTSMIDVSDGLASEVFHLCKESKIGVKLYEEKIPIDQQTYDTALELNLSPTTAALSGGDDFELMFTISQNDYSKIEHSPDFSVIGYCTAPHEGIDIITKSGNLVPLEAQGWENYKPNNEDK
ncbi:MAG: Thiamine-monophosphate kinase [Bacteroidota bacterium]|jgi:thiamine-monophosphate kinase